MASPSIKLNNGVVMPIDSFGTWKIPQDKAKQAVLDALEAGYRSIDCAAIYGNEKQIGEAFKEAFSSGKYKREEVFITSKLWNTCHKKEHVQQELEQTLKDLQLDYLDLYLVHWPVAFEFTTIDLNPGVPKDSNGKIKFAKVTNQETWHAMEDLLSTKKVRAVGVSNWNIIALLDLLAFAKVVPAINQIEVHPYNNREELIAFCKSHGINVTAYSPLGSGKEGPLSDATIAEIAKKYNKSPAQILLKWNSQNGHTVISKSEKKERTKENLSINDFTINEEDMKKINSLNRNLLVCDTREYWGFPTNV